MAYPSKSKLKAMSDKLKNLKGTLMVGPSSTPLEKFRWELCQNLVKFMVHKKISQVEFAELLSINPSRVSEIINHRIDKVSTDKLILYNEIIYPQIRFKIA